MKRVQTMKPHKLSPHVFSSSHFPSLPPAGTRAVGKNRLWSKEETCCDGTTSHTNKHKLCTDFCSSLLPESRLQQKRTKNKTESPLTTQSALLVSDLYRTQESWTRLKALWVEPCLCEPPPPHDQIVLKPTQQLQTCSKRELLFISVVDITWCIYLKKKWTSNL